MSILAFAAFALAICLPATAHAAEDNAQEKRDFPIVVSHLIQEDSDSIWYSEADFAQGQDIPFCVVSTLPENIATRGACPYWLRVRTDTTFAMQAGSIRVVLNRAGGSSEDVTALLSVSFAGNLITAGSSDINAAVPSLGPDDTFSLYYTMRFADAYRFGYGNGNSNYAYLLYDGTSYADRDAADQAGLQAASAEDVAATEDAGVAAPPVGFVERAYAAQETPGADLASSPEVKVTAYTYSIDVEKRAEHTAKLLAGAAFSLRDEAGQWYVRGKSWSPNQAEATVFTTDAKGHLAFIGLDADQYELVELTAPTHYLPVGPIDVLIESDVANQGNALRVMSKTATVEKVTPAEGTILLAVEDPKDPVNPDPNPSSNHDPSPNPGPGSSDSGPASTLAKMGDVLFPVGLALFSLAFAIVALAAYRKASRVRLYEQGNLSEGVACPDTRERIGHDE